ncbi:MAG TPA: tetratricopeptide repeat protein [Blastocatellia bacterium]|nr:tetratricopeptide repeat protein [Blastocatellia bacterium]
MKRPAFFIILFGLLFSVPAGAADAAFLVSRETWTSVQSRNFLLVGNADERDLRRTAVRLEQFREVFGRLFGRAGLNVQAPIHVIVFRSLNDYRPFMPVYNGRTSEVAGYFQSGEDVSYITLTSELSETSPYGIIFHEYVHAITNDNLGRLPPWLGEGLAEFYSSFEIAEGDRRVLLGRPLAHHVALLREHRLLPPGRLFAVDYGSPEYGENDRKNIFYAESWALVHYLMLGNRGARQPQLMQLLELLGRGAPFGAAFRQAFQTDEATLEKELREYLSRNSWPVTSFTFDQKLEFDATLQSAPVTEAERQFHLGDLLRHAGRAEAEEYLQRALQLDPNLTAAQASLGMLRMQQGRFAEAREHLQRALALAAAAPERKSNYLAHYYYAFTLSREGAADNIIRGYTPEQARVMRAELQRAIALNPDFAESYHLLAFVNFIAGEQLEETVALLKRAIALAPSRQEYQLQLAKLYLRLSRLSEAREILAASAAGSADPELREEAQSLLESIDRQIRFQAEQEALLKAQGSARTALTGPVTGDEDPVSATRPTLRRRAEDQRVQGQLTRIDCTGQGATLIVRAGDRTFRFHAGSLDRLKIVGQAQPGSLGCEPLKKPLPVIVIYRAAEAGSAFDGVPVTLELVRPQ